MKGAFQINSWPEIYICAINNMTTRAYEMQKSILQVINFVVPTTIVWVYKCCKFKSHPYTMFLGIFSSFDEKTTGFASRDKVSCIWQKTPKCIGVPGEAFNLEYQNLKISTKWMIVIWINNSIRLRIIFHW